MSNGPRNARPKQRLGLVKRANIVPGTRAQWRLKAMKLKTVFVLLLFAVFDYGQTFQASATPPPDEIFTYADGIGLLYSPKDLEINCQKGLCTIRFLYDRVAYQIFAPSDLVYFGDGCGPPTSELGSTFQFVPGVTRLSSDEARVRLESQRCRGRYIDVSYKVRDWSDESWISSNIAIANESWFICKLATQRTIACDNSPAISATENARIMSSLQNWVASRGRRF